MGNRIERRTRQPKGSMCTSCSKSSHDCSNLPFEQMPVIGQTSEGIKVVRCTEFDAAMKPLLYLDRWIHQTSYGYRFYLDFEQSNPCHHGTFATIEHAKAAIERARG